MEESQFIVSDIYKELLSLKERLVENGEIKNEQEIELYLVDHLFPVLFPAIEELSKEIERYQDPSIIRPLDNKIIPSLDVKIDPNIRSRFNPCLFLGQYLMRNNPKSHPELHENSMFLIFSERIRKSRTLESLKDEFTAYFKKHNENQSSFAAKTMDGIIVKFDQILGVNGRLINHIQLSDVIIGYKERKQNIPLEEFYKELQHIFVKDTEIKNKDILDRLVPEIKA